MKSIVKIKFRKSVQIGLFKFANISQTFSGKEDSHEHHHSHHKEDKKKHHKEERVKEDDWVEDDLPNINTTTTESKDTSMEYNNHSHTLNSTRKIYGNMVGMDKVDEYTTTADVDKEILKDGSKSSARPSKAEFVFRGNLNVDNTPPPEKDITDDNKTH